jgi:uncharacterized repeat protein (TIGR01451 family)
MARISWRVGVGALALVAAGVAAGPAAAQVPAAGLEVQQIPERMEEPGVAAVTILVQNRGPAADGVTVTQTLPTGCEVRLTQPPADPAPGRLVWPLGRLAAGEQRSLKVRLAVPAGDPRTELVSTVTASWQNSVTGSTSLSVCRPSLAVTVTGPDAGVVGEPATFQFAITNRSSAALKGVSLQTLLPAGLSHPAGADLENDIGDLAAGETRVVQLEVTPTQAGELSARAKVSAAGVEPIERKLTLKARIVKLSVTINGPVQCCSGWPCTYDVTVANEGPEPLAGARAIVQLPNGLSFVRGSEAKVYDAVTHSVQWPADDLPPGGRRTFAFYAVATESGEQSCRAGVSLGGRPLKQATLTTRVMPAPAE